MRVTGDIDGSLWMLVGEIVIALFEAIDALAIAVDFEQFPQRHMLRSSIAVVRRAFDWVIETNLRCARNIIPRAAYNIHYFVLLFVSVKVG